MTAAQGFREELTRPFPAHETCYDCVDSYDGCSIWLENKPSCCTDYRRLPGVLPGTCGPRFPPSRWRIAVGQGTGAIGRWPASEPDAATPSQVEVPPRERPTIRPEARPRTRICVCGAPLAKGKRLCDACQAQNGRKTQHEYMRSYREQRLPTSVGRG